MNNTAICEVCKCSVDVRPLYRVNPIGIIPALWRCDLHMTAEHWANVDPETLEIVQIIDQDRRRTHARGH